MCVSRKLFSFLLVHLVCILNLTLLAPPYRTTSMDAHRQAVMAAKGQTLSVAFYPRKGVICYGSEQAAVKVSQDFCFIDLNLANNVSTSLTQRFHYPPVIGRS